jgi:5'-methylthioadenosine phosphorylase
MLGIIGGSGIYELEGLKNAQWRDIDTPFGKPSDALLIGELDGAKVAFLPRHGRGHRIPPSLLNVRANISALKQVGVTDVLALSAVGSLKEDLPPGTFVVVDQFIDLTKGRPSTFFDEGLVAHVSMAHPVCARVGDAAEAAAKATGGPFRRGGTYVCMEGPQFSSKAESLVYRSWGAHVIGMTNMPEAKLAREAELCFATVAMVTDFDCWHPDHDAVTAAQVVATFNQNASRARDVVRRAIPLLVRHPATCPHGCDRSLDAAVLTAPHARDELRQRLLAAAGLRFEIVAPKHDPHGLAPLIRTVPDFPKKGIQFRDITTLLEDGPGFKRTVRALVERYRGQRIDKIMGIDARGFILGGAMAYELGCGFAAVRKKGKLPGATLRMEYALEYGTDAVEIREEGLRRGERVVIVDDLIATGGTAEAAIKLARLKEAVVVEACFVIELPDLNGRKRLEASGAPVHSLVTFEGD